MRRRHVRSLRPAPAFAPAAPHSITACFAGSKHTMQASFPKRSLSCPDALDPACRAPAPERGENAHATGNVETRRPEPKTASDSPGMPKAAPLRCCAHGGSRGTGARWRLRSFIREDNANPNRGSCADTLPTAKTRAASGRDGGCEASSGKITPRSGVRSTRSPDAGQAATIPPADTAAPHTDRRRTAARTGNGRSRNDDRQHRDNNRCTD